jgi:recombination associated protein RdgC
LYADHVHLGLRIDRWRVPRNLFKAHYAIAERELMDTQGIHRLSRSQKEDLQVFVMRRLRKQTIPAMRHVELSWELGTGLVRIASTSKPVLAHAVIQFEKTFKLQIAEHGVLTGMERAGFDEARLTKLVALQPARLHAEDEPAKRGAKAEG